MSGYNGQLRRATVESMLDGLGIPYGYYIIKSPPPYIAWYYTASNKSGSDERLTTSTDTVVVELYTAAYDETAEDAVIAALGQLGDDIHIERGYIDSENLFVASFTVTHTGRMRR